MDSDCIVILDGNRERAKLLGRIQTANGGLLARVRILSGPEAWTERTVNYRQVLDDPFELEPTASDEDTRS